MWRRYSAVIVFFCEIGISALLEKHCSNDVFYRKTAVSPTGTAVPEKQGIRVRLRAARSFYSRFTTRETEKAIACQRLPERRAAPSGRTKPRFPFSFGSAPFISERRRRRKEKTAPLRGQPKIRMIARYFLSALPSPEARLRRRRIFLPTCALRDRRK